MTQPLNGRRVLVVEDESLVAMLLETILEDMECIPVGPVSNIDDGEAMAPLEALGVKSKNDGPVPDGGEELAAAAKAHYDKIRAERLRADKHDRLREKERLRDIRNKERMKRRKADGMTHSDSEGDDDDDDDDAGVQLGGASESESEESDSEPRKRQKVDVAVAGMATKDETVESMEERALRLLRGK